MTVSGNPLLFTKTAVLDSRKHSDWKITPQRDFKHCLQKRFLPITLPEFSRVALEQPIVFVQDKELIVPITVLGLNTGDNLFVDTKGLWMGDYIPAYARMYPFILAPRQGRDDYSVCIDESYPGFNVAKGNKLFAEKGSQSKLTQDAVTFATEYQRQREQSLLFTARIQSLGLLESANFTATDSDTAAVAGFLTINREKLAGLSEAVVLELFQEGGLELLYLQLASLTNFERLIALGKQRRAAS